jgi:hypothetical protein
METDPTVPPVRRLEYGYGGGVVEMPIEHGIHEFLVGLRGEVPNWNANIAIPSGFSP